MKPFTAKQIIKAIGNKHIDLIRVPGKEAGYWYFAYDDVPNKIFETYSVLCMYLNHMEFDRWVEIGQYFVAKIKAEHEEM